MAKHADVEDRNQAAGSMASMQVGESILPLFMIGLTAVAVSSSEGNGLSIGCNAAT